MWPKAASGMRSQSGDVILVGPGKDQMTISLRTDKEKIVVFWPQGGPPGGFGGDAYRRRRKPRALIGVIGGVDPEFTPSKSFRIEPLPG